MTTPHPSPTPPKAKIKPTPTASHARSRTLPTTPFIATTPSRPVEPAAAEITIAALVPLYLEHCAIRYTKYGWRTSTYDVVELATTLLLATGARHVTLPWFGPVSLDEFRRWLASHPKQRWSRKTIIEYTRNLVDMIEWAASRQLTTHAHVEALRTLDPLRRGRSITADARPLRDTEPVRSVSQATLDQVLPKCGPMLADMLRLVEESGMRPGEVVAIRGCDLRPADKEGALEYVVPPEVNKVTHMDQERIVYLSPACVAILRRWALKNLNAYLFSPRRAYEIFLAARAEKRATKMWKSHTSKERTKRRREAGVAARRYKDHYTTASFNKAVARACVRAKVTSFGPNQLRHTAATRIANDVGAEVAQLLLGHADIKTTLRYVDPLRAKAVEYVTKTG